MNHPPAAATASNGADFDARQAAALLDQTSANARRQFESNPPWLLVTRAVLALVAYGALWLSVRGQHPYMHPTTAVVPVGVGVGVVNVVATITLAKRASAGISGGRRLRPVEIAIMAAVWCAVFVAIWPMAAAGVSDRIVYGLYPATAPLIIAGLAWAGIMAARADWRACGSGLAAAALGGMAWLAGPAAAWAVVGIGVAVLLLEHAAEISLRHRA